MRIISVSGNLVVSWRTAYSELNRVLGSPSQDKNSYVWSIYIYRFFKLQATANKSSGEIKIELLTKIPYRGMSFTLILWLLVSELMLQAEFRGTLSVLFLLLALLIPIISYIIITKYLFKKTIEIYEYQNMSVTSSILLPIAGVVVIMWLQADNLMLQVVALVSTLFTSYAGFWIFSSRGKISEQYHTWLIGYFSAIPIMITIFNFGLLSYFSNILSPVKTIWALLFLVISTVLTILVYGYNCRQYVIAGRDLPYEPFPNLISKTIWTMYVLIVNVCMALSCVMFMTPIINIGNSNKLVNYIRSGYDQMGLPASTIMPRISIILLATPVIILIVLFVLNIVRQTCIFVWVISRSDITGDINSEVPVRVLKTSKNLAHSLYVPFIGSYVILSGSLVNNLSHQELQAVVAHESYHAKNKHGLRNLLATIFGLLVGGQNVVLSIYDYPKIEQKADEYAVSAVGSKPLIQALRRLENVGFKRVNQPSMVDTDTIIPGSWLMLAPYHILFGSFILDNAHASVDQRIKHIQKMNINDDC